MIQTLTQSTGAIDHEISFAIKTGDGIVTNTRRVQTRLHRMTSMLGLTALLALAGSLQAGNLYVPNGSFEAQATFFADPRIDLWQKAPQPPGFDTNIFGAWDNLAGVFFNAPAAGPDYIDNAQGNQLAYLFAYPQLAIFQDHNSTDWANGAPSHSFNAKYEIGKSYRLTVGLTSSSEEPLTPGSTLLLTVYYRDSASNVVTVASTTATYDTNVFKNITHLVDFQVTVPAVKTNDAWAGQYVGIQIQSTVSPFLIGGVWDLDNVRLTETLAVPNFSFEAQSTSFADPRIDSWQKSAQPAGFDTNIFGAWDNLSGVFFNSPAAGPDYIDNADGNQLAFVFAYPGLAIFQDNNSTDWTGAAPTHAFNAKFEVGKGYRLTVGLTTSSEEPLYPGATLDLSLYYRDSSSNMVIVATTTATYDTNVFSSLTHLVDFQVNVPSVKATNAWAGQNIGIQIQSSISSLLLGGVWDVDNVRLEEIPSVPNFSFESQPTLFADPRIDSWQIPPQPATFDTNIFGAWGNLVGVFSNSPAAGPDYIVNADGTQLAYLFAYPQLALFQDVNSTDWSMSPPTHAFNVKFKPGKSYSVTVGLTSSSEEPLTPGSTLAISLYYRDGSNNMVTVASTTATYNTNTFADLTHLVDFTATVPKVKASDPWAGQYVGIQFASTVSPFLIGGVWDLDNVRFVEQVPTELAPVGVVNGHFTMTITSQPGLKLKVLAGTDLRAPLAGWTNLGTVTNEAGIIQFTDPDVAGGQRFYQVQRVP